MVLDRELNLLYHLLGEVETTFMTTDRSARPTGVRRILLLALLLLLSPLILVFVVVFSLLWALISVVLSVLVWILWCPRGKDVLFVYSDSPVWHDYIEEQILPRIEARAVILNWSDRRHWLDKYSLAPLLFRHFGGYREYNPLAIYFRPFRPHRRFRFWQAFRDYKHGKADSLQRVEKAFFAAIDGPAAD